MAKIYGEIQASALMTFDKSFARSNGQPLESTEIHYSLAAAEAYAATEVAYAGQEIAVVDAENKTVTRYVVQTDSTLKPAGTEVLGDGYSIVKNSDGTLSLVGFAGAETGAQPRKKADGTIEWVKPDTTTVDGINTTVEGLVGDVENLASTVGNAEGGLVKDVNDLKGRMTTAEDDIDALDGRVTDNKGAIDTLNSDAKTEGSIDYKIAQAVAAIMENPDETKNSISELVTWCDDHAADALELSNQVSANKTDIAKLAALIGNLPDNAVSTDVVSYIGEAISALSIGNYAKAADLTAAIERIASLEGKSHEHANADVLDEITTEKVADWTSAERNKIDDVSDEFTISDDRVLSVAAIPQEKVSGLPDALRSKVEKVEGKQLSTEDFTTDLKNKLGSMNADAAPNVIEVIRIDGVDQNVYNKAVDIPGATAETLGLVKGSSAENHIKVNDNFTMEIGSLNVNRLVQTDGDVLILDGGSAAVESSVVY